jgi:hypothetical protein
MIIYILSNLLHKEYLPVLYHKLSAALFAGGIDALLALRLQQLPENTELLFEQLSLQAR